MATLATPFASFRGHRGAVNALLSDDDRHPNVLVSGSEDGTCRLWDVRSTRASKCINVKKALGLTGGADAAANAEDDASVNALAFGNAPYLYLAANTSILTFDIRQEALILDCASNELFQHSTDEINSLSVQHHTSSSSSKKQAKFLSSADDNGDIFIYSIDTHRLHKTLRGQHTNICMSAPFRPNAPWDLVSGGMDGLLLFWDFSRGRMKFCIDLNAGTGSLASTKTSLTSAEGDGGSAAPAEGAANRLFNPPLVHSIAFASNGKTLAAALGDGSIAVVDFNRKQIIHRLQNHAAAVSQVVFCGSSTETSQSHDTWLVSCGNDAKISVFDFAKAVVTTAEEDHDQAFVVNEFAVQRKPNAIATSSLQTPVVHVADPSNVIASYPLL